MNIKDDEGIPLNQRYALPSETSCTFTYWVLINDTNGQRPVTFGVDLFPSLIYNSADQFLYVVNSNRLKGQNGSISIKPQFFNLDISLELLIPFSCLETPIQSFVQNVSTYPYVSYQATFLIGIKFNAFSKYTSTANIVSGNSGMPGLKPVTPTRTFFNIFIFQIIPNVPQAQNSNLPSSSISVFDGLFTVPFSHIYKSFSPLGSFSSLSNQVYPNNCANSPTTYWHCYLFMTFNTNYQSYFFNTFDASASASKYLFKVKGNSSLDTITYLNILPTVDGARSYSIQYFDGNKLSSSGTPPLSVSYTFPNNYIAKSGSLNDYPDGVRVVRINVSLEYLGPLVFTGDLMGGIQRYYPYPFGVISTSQNVVDYSVAFITPPSSYNSWWIVNLQYSADTTKTLYNISSSDVPPISIVLPKLTLLDYKDNGDTFSLLIGAQHSSGISSISVNLCTRSCINIINPSHLVQGTIFNGVYRYTLLKNRVGLQYTKADIFVKSRDGNSKSYKLYDVYNDSFDYVKPLPFFEGALTPETIKRIYFEKNNVDVTNNQVDNTMYIETTKRFDNFVFGFHPNYMLAVKPVGTAGAYFFRDESDPQYTSIWNGNLNRYEIRFKIPKSIFGPVPYIITPLQLDNTFFYNYLQNGIESELRIISKDPNILPPIIETIDVSPAILSPPVAQETTTLYFLLTLSESSNGFSYGIVNINSDYDPMGRNITFTGPGDILNCSFQISYYDRPQTYKIGYIWLNDTQGHISEYPSKTKVNPLMKHMDTLNTKTIKVGDVGYSYDTTPPKIESFKVDTLNLNDSNRTVSFTIMAIDPQSGIYTSGLSSRLLPVVYLSSSNFTVISSVAQVEHVFPNGSTIYKTSITISYGFGYPEGILISIFGLTDNNLNTKGYQFDDLAKLEAPYRLNSSIYEGPFISNSQYSNGLLTLNGFRFGLSKTKLIVYYQYDNLVDTIVDYVSSDDRKIVTDKIKDSVYENYITIKIITNDGLESNSLTVKIGNPQSTTPPVNQTCPGNPVCGGPEKGVCQNNFVCNCIEPYNGIDCTSMNTGSVGEVNPTNPNVNFTYVDDNNKFKSLIIIYSLTEIDIYGTPVETYIFSNWSYLELDSNNYQFNTTFKSMDNAGEAIDTHLLVTITKFDKRTTVLFANQTLTMEPSTIKYSMALDQYNFKNQLNTLKLLIYTSLEASKTDDICSSIQFGDNSIDSNYAKVKVGNLYLYGRFIKRGIIDGIVQQISHGIDIQNSTSSKSQTFISINLPNYRRYISIDPDFSVLIDNTNSNDPNSICASKSLTKAQLVGIIVGGAMFIVAILIIGSIVLFRRSTTFRLFYYRLAKKHKAKKIEMK
ncbi:hypothetical protein DICPUDRAFT_76235 [Dictyostelium purpureum]|uniref:EGF-like domain-containing protein n=1 Tax=Dictyostelium purpureum TaxID=5786 RepID=F0ZD04_DICPU|nr:uncharacterized protein DICPUDRAFT_76235 [Dictyostelium purpureum]EGC38159.1 hypothetical protein DICPUDRAFT_76235 [Dictyostelium purpureum]|eukprot:XP_003285286.1 hypothetical protein DICPUDRAFT_76235 [Dictyostelium purpureum]